MQNLRCKIHPSQTITNFCTRQECLVELCATCICSHTDMHGLNGTLPHYENIQQTYKRAQETCDIQKNIIEQQKLRIMNYNKAWQKNKECIFSRIENAKRDVLDVVEKTFQQLKLRYTQAIIEEQIKIGMKNGDKVMKMLQLHTSQADQLTSVQKELAANRGTQIAKNLFTVILPQSNQNINRVKDDFSDLQAHTFELEYLQNNLLSVKQKINQLLLLKVRYPQKPMIVPVTEIIETLPAKYIEAQQPFVNSCTSTFYTRPQSAGKPLKGSVMYVNGNNQFLVQQKPKISVVSGRFGENLNMGSRIILRNSRKNIFPVQRIINQIR